MTSKKIVLFIVFAAFMACGPKRVETKYDNGKINESYTINKEGQKHGEFVSYFDNGKVKEKSTYKNDKLIGERLVYDYDGTLDTKENYNNYGNLHGEHLTYYNDGKSIQIKKQFQHNVLEGKLIKYYKNGQIEEEVNIENNEENGPFIEYYQNGAVHWKGTYLEGDDEYGELLEYDSLGQMIKKMNCNPKGICHTVWKNENK